MAGEQENILETGDTCNLTLRFLNQVLGKGKNVLVENEGRWKGMLASARRKRTSPSEALYGSRPPTHMARFCSDGDGPRSLRILDSSQRHRDDGMIAQNEDLMRRSCKSFVRCERVCDMVLFFAVWFKILLGERINGPKGSAIGKGVRSSRVGRYANTSRTTKTSTVIIMECGRKFCINVHVRDKLVRPP